MDGGPCAPTRRAVASTFGLLREIKAAAARYHHWEVDESSRSVTAQLPVSKTNPCAVGCARSWGCACAVSPDEADGPAGGRGPLPFCAVRAQKAHNRKAWANNGALPEDLPLFRTVMGSTPAKAQGVATIEAFAQRLEKR